ncbi:hypothetical protein ZIOFF_057683 [Zingiber officinale]|uniref:RRM domain-containing protein n=1 Tax=Zingiber officinale TaxID=94328 RepID=A0A8J5F3X9_ZINOF|nr:hypothetical protein ZIOFF_057683 [Zingiber officinale]
MSSVEDCEQVINNLDRTQFGGRTMKVNFADKPKPKEPLYPETEHKLFVGNLSWSVTSEVLTEVFQEHGNVVGARVLYDGDTRATLFFTTRSAFKVELAALLNRNELKENSNLLESTVEISSKGDRAWAAVGRGQGWASEVETCGRVPMPLGAFLRSCVSACTRKSRSRVELGRGEVFVFCVRGEVGIVVEFNSQADRGGGGSRWSFRRRRIGSRELGQLAANSGVFVGRGVPVCT